jgi:branched-chain amino acid transport system substrate-binding protein
MLIGGGIRRKALVVTVAALAAAACSSSSKSTSPGTPTGKSPSSDITIGIVTSLTGPASANFNGAVQGAQARFDLQNAQGGVNGHQIKLITGDDTSSPTGAETAVNELVQVRKVFGLIFISDLTSAGAYRLPQQMGIPVVGFPTDGPEWAQQPNTNMVATWGDQTANPPITTVYPKIAQLVGAKNLADLAIGNEPPSDVAAEDFAKAAKSVGLKVGYVNDSIPLGSVNVTSTVLAMKQAGVDGFNSEMLINTNLAIMEGAKQAGIKLVASLLPTGYDQSLLDDQSAVQAAQGGIFLVEQVPFEEKTAATKAEQSAFETYEHFSGVPNLNWSEGWISADLWVQGLEKAGQNPTHASFLTAVRSLKGYTANGLLPQQLDLSLQDFGKETSKTVCNYFVTLRGTTFVPLNGGKAICGDVIG